jgi:hypothetical protein
MPTDWFQPPSASNPSVRQRIPGQDVLKLLYRKLPINQCSGSMTFLYGYGFADPYRWVMDPDQAF